MSCRAVWSGVLLALLLGACAPMEEGAVASDAPLFSNGGFESGTNRAPPPGWTVRTFQNPMTTGFTPQSPQTVAGLNLLAGGTASTVTLVGVNQMDMALGTTAPFRWPRYGTGCAVVNGPNAPSSPAPGAGRNVNVLSQTMTIGAGDVDPVDAQVHIRFVMAPLLVNSVHMANQRPYYMVLVTNVTRGTQLYQDFDLSTMGGSYVTVTSGSQPIGYRNWTLVDVAPGASGIAIGDTVQLDIYAAGCSENAHWAEVYVDGLGAVVPGIAVEGTGPAYVDPSSLVTYVLTYRNGSLNIACTTSANCSPNTEACVGGSCAETGVVIDFPIPAGTTFVSSTAPPGASCVSSATNVTCTLSNPLPAGAMGSLSITVHAGAAGSGPIVASGYDIRSTQETALDGPAIHTSVGCSADSGCPAGQWCNETTSSCAPRLANGVAIPNDPPHTSPVLNGVCTAGAATLVCISGLCDVGDNECGLANGDAPCTAANGTVVCRSRACGSDGRCGFVIDEGPCTAANAMVVCRSGACSTNGHCEPPGGCDVDADCNSGRWCDETRHACAPALANGAMLQSDPAHTSPTLDGTCTAAAGALQCASGVCDTIDDRCGYATGDGPCDAVSGPVVCRSGACSTNGLCEPDGGCNEDADCASGTWCLESMHVCTPTLANGMPLPVDAAHTSPALDGTCSAAAGALVCASGVCDTDDHCGYANGDGPCTALNGAAVCRSTTCSASGARAGTCVQCNDDSACTGTTPVCDVAAAVCVQCTLASSMDCGDVTPVCDMATEMCAACVSDFGSGSARACATAASPFCMTTGACGHCTDDTSCRTGTHAGPICNTTSGACGTQCTGDADCDGATPICDATSHMCVAADAGPSDAGADRDAARLDAGTAMRDGGASMIDATVGADAGTSMPTMGGCSCRATGRTDPSRGSGMIAIAIALLAVRRRSRRARREL